MYDFVTVFFFFSYVFPSSSPRSRCRRCLRFLGRAEDFRYVNEEHSGGLGFAGWRPYDRELLLFFSLSKALPKDPTPLLADTLPSFPWGSSQPPPVHAAAHDHDEALSADEVPCEADLCLFILNVPSLGEGVRFLKLVTVR